MPHFFASNLRAVALPARTKNFEFIFEAKSVRDESVIIFAKSLAKSLHGEQKILLSKQKKGERLLVKFNKHFAPHSKEIIKSALKEYAELAGAEIANHNLNENKIKVDSAYLLDWRGVCTLLGGDLHLGLQFHTKNAESSENSPSLSTSGARGWVKIPSLRDSAKQNRGNPQISSLRADSQNLRGKTSECEVSCNPPIEKTQKSQSGLPRSLALARNDAFILDSANPSPSYLSNSHISFAKRAAPPAPLPLRAKKLRFFAFRGSASLSPLLAKNRRLHFCNLAPDFLHHEAGEFSGASHGFNVDSAESQNLDKNQSRVAQPLKASSGEGEGVVREGEGGDFAIRKNPCIQAPAPSLKKNACRQAWDSNADLSAQGREEIDSAPQAEFAFLEIGFGSGRHILHLAQKHPSARIIGLEIYRPAISQVLRQIEILGLQNLYLASIDARVLCEVLPAKCLDRIYLHFPVPWLKNPQRRVLSAQFLGNAMRALKTGGVFELLTDSAEYFAFAKALAGDYKFVAEEGAKGEVVSKYEARWRRQEKVIYRLQIFSNSSLGNSVLGMQFRTKSTESSADSATRTPLISLFSFSQKGLHPPPRSPCAPKSSAFSLLGGEPRLSASSKKSAGGTTAPFESDFLHHEAGEFSGASHGFNADSALAQNLVKNKSREAQPLKALSGEGEGVVREGEGSDFAIQAPAPSLKENARGQKWDFNADLSAKGREENRDSSPTAHNDNLMKIAESRADSAFSQNLKGGWLLRNARKSFGLPRERSSLAMTENRDFAESSEKNKSKKHIKSFCYFWLSPKVESPLPLNPNLPNNVDSAILQNLGENGGKVAESTLDSANPAPFSPTKICKKEYFLHIKNKYIFEGGVVLFASFGAYYAPSSAYFVICGNCVYTISEIIPTRANIDAVELFMELCFDN